MMITLDGLLDSAVTLRQLERELEVLDKVDVVVDGRTYHFAFGGTVSLLKFLEFVRLRKLEGSRL